MTHYETLGVSPDATPDEIKQAFRRRASEAHPDKGGEPEGMAEINRAYEALSDPDRRAEYDSTGTNAGKSIDVEARDALITLFRTSLENDGDHVDDVAQMLNAHLQGLRNHQSAVEAERKRLVKRRKRISVRAGENLFHALIDQRIEEIDAALARLPRGLEVNRRATEMLTNYEMTEESLTALISGWKAGT